MRGGELLDNGFTLLEVLQFLMTIQERNSHLFSSMITDLQNGEPIYQVFLNHGFDNQTCATLYFAERHGDLSVAFQVAGKHLLKKDEDRKKLRKLMQYPIVLVSILLFVTMLLNLLLLPRFHLLYQSMGYQPTGMIWLNLHLLQNLPYYLLIIVMCAGLIFLLIKRRLKKKTAFEKAELLATLPFIKSFYRLYQTIFLSREWSYLLRSGFSLNEVIAIMEKQHFRPIMKETAEVLKKRLLFGFSFSDALSHISFVENELVYIVAHGEKTGRMERELLYYSNICVQQLEDRTLKLMMVIQPIAFSLIGIMVIAIYLTILYPMFQMIQSI